MTARIPTLDGWRAVAITMVVVHHIAVSRGNELWVFGLGRMGVDVFFAISGLLITSRLLEEWDSGGRLRLGEFYIRRAFRILPVALLYLTTLGVLGLFTSTEEWISALTFWRNYAYGGQFSSHFWSLSIEEQFYLVWPAVLLFAGYWRAPKIAGAVIGAVALWRLLEWSQPWASYFRTDMRADGLAWGCLAAFALRRGLKIGAPSFVACLLLPPFLFGRPIAMALMPAFLAGQVLGTVEHPEWKVSRLLEWKPLTWIGQRSYGIYVWQELFIFYGAFHLPFWLGVAVRLGALVIFTELSYRYFEVPFQNFGRRRAVRLSCPKLPTAPRHARATVNLGEL